MIFMIIIKLIVVLDSVSAACHVLISLSLTYWNFITVIVEDKKITHEDFIMLVRSC